LELFARLSGGERTAALGAAAMPLSLLFPWYGFKLGSPISATAIDSFNFAHAALLLTAAAVIYLLMWASRPLPRPLSVDGLLIAAGLWSFVILAYLFADPPDELVDIATIGGVRIRYGAYVAAGAAAAMVIGGIRARADRREK
jgi:uncharacterized membrane protein YvlD (DUF360 family)